MKRAVLQSKIFPAMTAVMLANLTAMAAVTIDESKLPATATNQIVFARDIKPIFEQTCIRCHGAERSKNHFSLITRESALKGGENGVDIIPGDSTKSPLIHFVARLVEDSEMPPPGKGEPLTPAQIALLRAWIDQGAQWETVPPESLYSLGLSLRAGGVSVNGDAHKFRENNWVKEGWNGGVEDFFLTDKIGKESKLTVEGHALVDDYKVAMTVKKNEVGFARFGWEQYRKYSDDSGGYFPTFAPSVFSLNRDLHLDIGRAWADFGLTLPDWPRMVIGYEYQYREGNESTLQWGSVNGGGQTRNIYPSAKSIDERVHILKFDLDHEIAGVRIEDSFRGEFYDLHTRQFDTRAFNVGASGPAWLDNVREGYNYFSGANTLRVDKSFTDWLFASAGYLYSKLNADATFSLDAQFPLGTPGFYAVDRWHSQEIVLERETHAFNASTLLGPWDGFTISAGVLSDWTRQTGFGRANTDIVTPFFTFARPETLDGNSDTTTVEENVALRYTKIPFTVLFAEGRLQQENRGLSEDVTGGFHDFMQRTDVASDLRDFRIGCNTSPLRWLSWNTQYRRYEKETDYDHLLDQSAHDAYPAFIRARDMDTDEVETKLTLRPCAWLKTSLSYKYETTEYQTATDPVGVSTPGDVSPGGGLESAQYGAHTYSLNATLTPWRRLYLSGTFSYQNTRTAAFANDNPSVVAYRGDRFSTLASATYALNEKTDLRTTYSYSRADYGQHNFADGLPLGIRYQQHALTAGLSRQISKNISAKLQYGFYLYDEPSSGGANNYTAHAVFGTLVMRLP